jgi:rhodanese-related sulfurtransferase
MTIAAVRGIDVALAQARRQLHRLDPREALAAQQSGALLIDTRPQLHRDLEGGIPGALVIERNVLEWRLDPTSNARVDEASYDAHVVLFCNEGYASSLAAVALQDLGVWRATDIVGGFRAWRDTRLAVIPPTP